MSAERGAGDLRLSEEVVGVVFGLDEVAAHHLAGMRSELDGLGPGPQRRLESVLHLVEHLGEVPVLVAAYAVEPNLDRPERQPVPPAILYGSIFPAVWSFQLALRARGLGSVLLFLAPEAALAEVLGAPEGGAPGQPPAGRLPHRYDLPARHALPLSDVVSWNAWHGPGPAA
jgi:hypothetical protein